MKLFLLGLAYLLSGLIWLTKKVPSFLAAVFLLAVSVFQAMEYYLKRLFGKT